MLPALLLLGGAGYALEASLETIDEWRTKQASTLTRSNERGLGTDEDMRRVEAPRPTRNDVLGASSTAEASAWAEWFPIQKRDSPAHIRRRLAALESRLDALDETLGIGKYAPMGQRSPSSGGSS
jgi:hypothetical protein